MRHVEINVNLFQDKTRKRIPPHVARQRGGIHLSGLFQEYVFINLYILFIASRSPGCWIKIAIAFILVIIP